MKEVDIRRLVRPGIRDLSAYDAREIPCRIKLDANESPFGFEESVLRALKSLKTNRYPDPEAKGLRKAIGRKYDVVPSKILLGNGSDELIYYLVTTFGGPVLYPVPTFSMYGIISCALGVKGIAVPLDKNFDIDLEKTLQVTRKEKPKIIFLSSPNNPTGNCFSTEKILRIIEVSRGLVVVDEAYQPFASPRGFLPFLRDYRNLVIMRTLSKVGMAALRLGFLVADPDIIAEVNKVRLPYNINSLSQIGAAAALRNSSVLNAAVKKIVAERERLFRSMQTIKGIKPFPSEANFILFKVDNPEQVYTGLLRKGILVRTVHPGVKGCIRVTIGTVDENNAFLAALKALTVRKHL